MMRKTKKLRKTCYVYCDEIKALRSVLGVNPFIKVIGKSPAKPIKGRGCVRIDVSREADMRDDTFNFFLEKLPDEHYLSRFYRSNFESFISPEAMAFWKKIVKNKFDKTLDYRKLLELDKL